MGLNFYLNKTDVKNKKAVNDTGFHIYAVRGNHEERPERLNMNQLWDIYIKGEVYYEPEFPNIHYLMDGGEYEINGYSVLVIGGAYSIDKWYRLLRAGYTKKEALNADPKKCGWFKNEQLTAEEMQAIGNKCKSRYWDFIFSHTCPYSVQPKDLFLPVIDQSTVDNTMEHWLDTIKDETTFGVWCFGHYHADRIEKPYFEQFYHDFEAIEDIARRWQDYYQKGSQTLHTATRLVSPYFSSSY